MFIYTPTNCTIAAEEFTAHYQESKKYLGRFNSLDRDVEMSLTFNFDTAQEQADFFNSWINETERGSRPFYVELPLNGEVKYYLILQKGDLTQTVYPHTLSGNFIVYKDKTLDENTPPSLEAQSFDVDMDSSNNYIYVQHFDIDYNIESYAVSVAPLHGTLTNNDKGVFHYTPSASFYGFDSFDLTITDDLGASVTQTISFNVINWKLNEEFYLDLDANGHLILDFVNPSILNPSVVSAINDLSTGSINLAGEYEINIPTTHIENITKTANDEWLITPK